MSKWDTFKKWHGDETFWRVVYAQGLAGLIAIFVAFIAGVISGLISIRWQQVARVVVTGSLLLVLMAIELALVVPIAERAADRYLAKLPLWARWLIGGLFYLTIGLLILVIVGAFETLVW